jgi:hypothetical protein
VIISDTPDRLRSWASEAGVDVASLDARQSLDLMLDWYARERAEDAHRLDEDGDGLLIQWGTYDFGEVSTFQFDVTRQFITADDEDPDEDAIWQLHLTVHYDETAETAAAEGSIWVFDPAETAAAFDEVANEAILERLDAVAPLRVVVEFERAD